MESVLGASFSFPFQLFSAVIPQLFVVMQPCCFLVTCKSSRSQFGKPSPKTLLLWRFNEEHFKKAFVGVGSPQNNFTFRRNFTLKKRADSDISPSSQKIWKKSNYHL
jgi:hypothetical protein